MCGCNNIRSSSSLSLYNLQEYFCTYWPGNCHGQDRKDLGEHQEQHKDETIQQNKDDMIQNYPNTTSKEIHNKIGAKTEQNNNDITIASIQTKLRHSSPLLFCPEEEEHELLSTMNTRQEYHQDTHPLLIRHCLTVPSSPPS